MNRDVQDWVGFLQPYTGASWNDKLYLCPTYNERKCATTHVYDVQYYGSYGYGHAGGSGGSAFVWSGQGLVNLSGAGNKATPDSAVKVPSDTYALADSRILIQGLTPQNVGVPWFDPDEYDIFGWVEIRTQPHLNGHNIAFCDGHTESVKRSKLIERSALGARRWFIDHEPHSELWQNFARK